MDRQIDELCGLTTKPHVLNALHACRVNHPLGSGNTYKWRNAYSLVCQNTVDFRSTNLDWIKKQSEAEFDTNPSR